MLLLLSLLLAIVPACSNEKIPKEENKPEEFVAEAMTKGYYVNRHGDIANEGVLPDFITKVENGTDARMSMIVYSIEGDPIVSEYIYQSNILVVKTDTRYDRYGPNNVRTETYKNAAEISDVLAELSAWQGNWSKDS